MTWKPEVLLKSALEKILYFEARSLQLTCDADTALGAGALQGGSAAASLREIELRRVVAELEVRGSGPQRARRGGAARRRSAIRERAELVGKMLEASRVHGWTRG